MKKGTGIRLASEAMRNNIAASNLVLAAGAGICVKVVVAVHTVPGHRSDERGIDLPPLLLGKARAMLIS